MMAEAVDSSESGEAQDARRILQIIPAVEYCVVYFDLETGEPWVDNVVCWALVEEPGRQNPAKTKVVGFVVDGTEVVGVDEFPNFVGYMMPTEMLDHWRDTSYEAWKDWRESGAPEDQSPGKRPLQSRS